MFILREVRLHTLVPIDVVWDAVRLLKPYIRNLSDLKEKILDTLPVSVLTLPSFDLLKKETNETFITLSSSSPVFPDNCAAPYWIDVLTMIDQRSQVLSNKFDMDIEGIRNQRVQRKAL